MNTDLSKEACIGEKTLSQEEQEQLTFQNSRLVPEHKAQKLEQDAKKHWDLFYKRNETRFFKDRRWTLREFEELLPDDMESRGNEVKFLFEVGCGVGNFIFPLIEDGCNLYMYACDFSPRAIDFVKQNNLYDETRVKAFVCDITTNSVHEYIEPESLDYVTLIFVLSAIHPNKHLQVIHNLAKLLKPGGKVLFRDYGLYDMAQLRFKPGHKIEENFYMRQDGTRSYYFSVNEISDLFGKCGFNVVKNEYIHRRTINAKENIDVPRIFVQSTLSRKEVFIFCSIF